MFLLGVVWSSQVWSSWVSLEHLECVTSTLCFGCWGQGHSSQPGEPPGLPCSSTPKVSRDEGARTVSGSLPPGRLRLPWPQASSRLTHVQLSSMALLFLGPLQVLQAEAGATAALTSFPCPGRSPAPGAQRPSQMPFHLFCPVF